MKKMTILLAWTLSLLAWGVVRAANPEGEVRNLIFMVGDGMGLAHVSMLMVENGYAPTSFDRAQGVGLLCTRSANNRVTDSAAAATALATGHKTGNGTIGQSLDGKRYESLMKRASGLRHAKRYRGELSSSACYSRGILCPCGVARGYADHYP